MEKELEVVLKIKTDVWEDTRQGIFDRVQTITDLINKYGTETEIINITDISPLKE